MRCAAAAPLARGALARCWVRSGILCSSASGRGRGPAAGWRRDVAVSHAKFASALVANGDSEGAREAPAAGPAILAPLVERHPDWAQWKQDLAWVRRELAVLSQEDDETLVEGNLSVTRSARRSQKAGLLRYSPTTTVAPPVPPRPSGGRRRRSGPSPRRAPAELDIRRPQNPAATIAPTITIRSCRQANRTRPHAGSDRLGERGASAHDRGRPASSAPGLRHSRRAAHPSGP